MQGKGGSLYRLHLNIHQAQTDPAYRGGAADFGYVPVTVIDYGRRGFVRGRSGTGGGMTMQPILVLLVEDNPDDVELTRAAFSRSKLALELKVADSGEKALQCLRNEPPCGAGERPDLVLLDVNLPGKSGKEVLSEIKNDPALKAIPVVILTGSPEEIDEAQCHAAGAACCLVKPVDFESFAEVIKTIEGFWFTVVKLPGKDGEYAKTGGREKEQAGLK